METQYQCRHVFTEGRRCKARCLRAEDLCYFHHSTRRRQPKEDFTLPPIEDRAALQVALDQIIARIANGSLDPRRAGLLLYALQLASSNLPKPVVLKEPEDTIELITQHPSLGTLAPQREYGIPPPPKLYGGRTLEQILLYDYEGSYIPGKAETLGAAETPRADEAPTQATIDLNASAEADSPSPFPSPGLSPRSKAKASARSKALQSAVALPGPDDPGLLPRISLSSFPSCRLPCTLVSS